MLNINHVTFQLILLTEHFCDLLDEIDGVSLEDVVALQPLGSVLVHRVRGALRKKRNFNPASFNLVKGLSSPPFPYLRSAT